MKRSLFRFTAYVLCIASGVLISFIEFQFFSGNMHTAAVFLAILCITLFLVFVYFSSGNSAIFLMLYSIALTFILDFLEKSVNVKALLLCLCCLGLLYAQSHFQANSRRFLTANPAFGPYFLILLVCFSAAVLSSYLLFRYVLEPLLPESERYMLLQQVEETEVPPDANKNAPEEPAGGGVSGGEGWNFSLQTLLWALLAVLTTGACCLLLWVLAACIRYRLWLRRTLASPRERQISELYRYTLRALAVCGYPRQMQQTPYEYLLSMESVDFPLPMEQFDTLTRTFVAARLGGKSVSERDYHTCLTLFHSISENFKKKMGLRRYLFRYLTRMHCRWSAI